MKLPTRRNTINENNINRLHRAKFTYEYFKHVCRAALQQSNIVNNKRSPPVNLDAC